MAGRYLSIWFRHLLTDRRTLQQPELADKPFVLTEKDHGRLVVTAVNPLAGRYGIKPGYVAADARAMIPGLEVLDDVANQNQKLLKALGLWCLRYTPVVAIDLPDGLMLDIAGCAHLWGGERNYLKEVINKLRSKGYDARGAITDTVGAAWAVARYGRVTPIILPGQQRAALLPLPPSALRLSTGSIELMQKLGFRTIGEFIGMQRSVLRRRFKDELLLRLDQAVGRVDEPLRPIKQPEPFQVRLPCLEPIKTATGIEIAIQKLLEMLCTRLNAEGKGLRTGILKVYRVDGKMQQLQIGTNRASGSIQHLFKLFELHIQHIEPDLGIELFILEAPRVDDVTDEQEALWTPDGTSLEANTLAELLDRITGKLGADVIKRYLPQEHHWPERSIRPAQTLGEQPPISWRTNKRRPTLLLHRPEKIMVTAPVPDYPPMLFIHKGQRHDIKKADGPERIEREWWLDAGEHRDYYIVEDTQGCRYWLFREGHYNGEEPNDWYLHGYFA